MRISLVILFCLLALIVKAKDDIKPKIPATGKTYKAFIPKGYDTLNWGESMAAGDLNMDGREDIVLVLRNIEEEKSNSDAARYIVIILKQEDGYKLACIADKIVLCAGINDEPYTGVFIKNGILNVNQSGGGVSKWATDMKFKYRDGDFYLIGRTDDSYQVFGGCETIGESGRNYTDINYLTGERIRKKTSDDCKVLLNKKDKIKVLPLVKMADSKAID